MTKPWMGKGFIEAVRLERERNPQAKAADMARRLGRSREAIRLALVELGLPTRFNVAKAKACIICGKKLCWGNRSGRCRGCFVAPEVKDAIVRDYLRGVKAIIIQLEHNIGSGVMYRILHARNVKLRQGEYTMQCSSCGLESYTGAGPPSPCQGDKGANHQYGEP